MPSFTVRKRNRKPVEPVVEPEPEVADEPETEPDYYDEEDEKLIEEYIREVQARKAAKEASNPVIEPQEAPQRRVQFAQPVETVQQRPIPVRHIARARSVEPINDPYRRKPTMRVPPRARSRPRGKSKIRYSSHYGMGGDVLGTHDKARLLYGHCFA